MKLRCKSNLTFLHQFRNFSSDDYIGGKVYKAKKHRDFPGWITIMSDNNEPIAFTTDPDDMDYYGQWFEEAPHAKP